MSHVRFEHVTKEFGDVVAVEDFTLDIAPKELIVFVGPSGCGKTTVLRMLAGLERPTAGTIQIAGRVVNRETPSRRNIAMVFQNFALYPHMTVFENIAVPLEVRKVSRTEIKAKVERIAELLGIGTYMQRRPFELSGGQKQRVALGRAIVREPVVLLMDEPLSNLDAKLRVAMRSELKRLTREVQTTTIYVTHDQTEAMTMGDRVVAMHQGNVQQVETPERMYDYPANLFVAGIIGSPGMNLLRGKIGLNGIAPIIDTPAWTGELDVARWDLLRDRSGRELIFGIRPEGVRLSPAIGGQDRVGRVDLREPQGPDVILRVTVNGEAIQARVAADSPIREGDAVVVSLDPMDVRIFDPGSTALLA